MSAPSNFEKNVVTYARKIARLQLRRRKLRAELKTVEAELRHEKKFLRAMIGTKADDRAWDEKGAESKVFAIKAGGES